MKSIWSRSVQMTLCAAAICAMGAVQAQETPRPLSATTTNAQTSTQAAPGQATGTSATDAQMPAQAAPSQARGTEAQKAQRPQRAAKGERQQGQRGKYANPHEHEAAAVRGEQRAGRLQGSQDMDQFQRNAVARCDVFRDAEDRRSCADRVRSGESTGSVRDGGMLREYSEQVPVRP